VYGLLYWWWWWFLSDRVRDSFFLSYLSQTSGLLYRTFQSGLPVYTSTVVVCIEQSLMNMPLCVMHAYTARWANFEASCDRPTSIPCNKYVCVCTSQHYTEWPSRFVFNSQWAGCAVCGAWFNPSPASSWSIFVRPHLVIIHCIDVALPAEPPVCGGVALVV